MKTFFVGLSISKKISTNYKHGDSAYLRQATSYQCRDTDPDPYPDRHQNLIFYSLAHCQPSLKISCKFVRKFLHKVANRQTDKQTNNDEKISLAEVIT